MEISLSHRSKKAQPTLPMRSTTPPFSPRWNDLATSPMHDHLENTGFEERLCLSSPDVYDKRSLRPSMAFTQTARMPSFRPHLQPHARQSAWSKTHALLAVVCAWLFLLGANDDLFAAHHSCECPAMQSAPANEDTAHHHSADADDTSPASSCACGAESPSDCHCEFKPHDPSSQTDAITWSAPSQLLYAPQLLSIASPPTTTAGFAPDTPPGNWLYGRPPPVSIYLLHRTLLI